MATIVDTLVTKYILSASDYESGAERVLKATAKIAAGLGGAIGKLTELGSKIKGNALVEFGVAASKSANELETLDGAWKAIMEGIGGAINSWAMPALQKVGAFLSYIGNSGLLEKIGSGFKATFGAELGDTLVQGLSWVVAVVKNLPTAIRALRESFVGAFRYISQHAAMFAAIFGGIFLGGSILRGIGLIIEGFINLRRAIQATGIASMIMEAITTGGVSLVKATLGAALGALAGYAMYKGFEKLFDIPLGVNLSRVPGIDAIKRDQEAIMAGFKSGLPGTTPPPTEGGVPKAASPEERTARATEKLVDYKRRQMDMQATMMGGGELARMGISPVEMRGAGSLGHSKLDQAVRLIAEYAGGLVSDRQVSDARHHGRYQGAF